MGSADGNIGPDGEPAVLRTSAGPTGPSTQDVLKSVEEAATTPSDPLTNQMVLDRGQHRELRKAFMRRMLAILIVQLAAVNVGVIWLALADKIKMEEWSLSTWIGGTLLEVFAIVLVIAKNLFPVSDDIGRSSSPQPIKKQ